MRIGFLLEGNGMVGLGTLAEPYQVEQPEADIQNVESEESDQQEFPLLSEVYLFMSYCLVVSFVLDEDERPECDGVNADEPAGVAWDEAVGDDDPVIPYLQK